MEKKERANFGSKLGVILASAGSAVGLGNIWRFPYETGNHGGAAFILIYLGCVLILGLPIMIAEFTIGRRSRANTAGAFTLLAPKTQWKWIGRMGVTCIHTWAHIHACMHTHRDSQACVHTHVCNHIQTHMNGSTQTAHITFTHTFINEHTHSCTHKLGMDANTKKLLTYSISL